MKLLVLICLLIGGVLSQPSCPAGLVVSETTTTATIEFTNIASASCYVNYGLTSALGTIVPIPNVGTAFNLTVTELTPNTTYYYQVNCSNASIFCATDIQLIVTIPPCNILSVNVIDYGDHVILTWTADTPIAYSFVQYGILPWDFTLDPITVQTITLTDLTTFTDYVYLITATDVNSQTCTWEDGFSTGSAFPCNVAFAKVVAVTATTAVISWAANVSSTSSRVAYGFSTSYNYYQGSTGPDSAILTVGLTPSTLYHYRAEVFDVNGYECYSVDATFQTLQPCIITNSTLTDIQDVLASLAWTTNQITTSGFVEYGLDTSYGTNISVSGPKTKYTANLQPLLTETTYHYSIFMNSAGGQCQTADATFDSLALCTRYQTFTQLQYSLPCRSTNPAGCILQKNFIKCFTTIGVWLGCPKSQGGLRLQFTNASSVARFLPKTGLPGKLGPLLFNPTINPLSNATGTDGTFAGEILTLLLNEMFDTCVPIGNCVTPLKDLCYIQLNNTKIDFSCNGFTVNQIESASLYVNGGCFLQNCQTFMGPASLLCSQNSTVLNACAFNINNNFVSGIGPYLEHCPIV